MRAIAAAVALLLAQPALADTTAEQKKAAAEHYRKAMTHYNLGEFDEAIAEFKAAYEISQAPELLFNIGQAFRLKEDYKQALFFYDTYLRVKPDAKNRADVEKWIAEMKRLVEEQRAPASAPASAAAPAPTPDPAAAPAADPPAAPAAAPAPSFVAPDEPAPPPATSPSPDQSGRGKRIAGLIVGSAGVVASGVGIYFAFRARSDYQMISDLADRRGNWNDSYAEVEADGKNSETAAQILIPIGAAAVVGGAVLYWLGWRDDRAPRVSAAGRGLVLGWSF